jgi:hypothetical protein
MKPDLSIKAYVYIGLRNLKDAGVRVLFEPSAYRLFQSRNLYILGLLVVGCLRTVGATEIVIKNVGDALFVATDSKGSEGAVARDGVSGGTSFGTCKILQIGRNQFFSFAGRRGGNFYNIRKEAVSAAALDGSIADVSRRFLDTVTPKVEEFRAYLNIIEDREFTSVAFYGWENGHAVCIKSTFLKSIVVNEITVRQQVCPPSCDPFISLGDGGVLADWAARNPEIFDERTPREIECLVRGAVELSRGAVGGSISVAKIDSDGLVWVDGERGACQTGPYEQRTALEADPQPCKLQTRSSK